jgi:5-methylcytosine-specific restriction endonuclease McrA
MDNGRFKKGFTPWNKGLKAKDDERIKRSINACHLASKGLIPWNKGMKYSEERKKEMSILAKRLGFRPPSRTGAIPWNKGKKYPQTTGERNVNWRGGVTSENEKIRKSIEYKEWRREVMKRDNYTCICCGTKQTRKNPMVVDHIKPFSLYPELRFEISNGRTFCKECDWKYGFRWNRHLSAEKNKALVSK